MKVFAILMVFVSMLLTGCIVAEPGYRGDVRGERDGGRGDRDRDGIPNRADRDRDGDGVPNRQDRRPDDPRRY